MKYLRFVVKRYLFAVISLLFVIAYWMSAGKLPEDSIVFPQIVTFLIIPIFVWVVIQSIKEYRELCKDESVPEEEKWSCNLNITKTKLVILVATILYVILIPIVGYCVMTAIYVAFLSYFLGNHNPVKLIIFAVVLVAVLYGIFGLWLQIRLPSGFLI